MKRRATLRMYSSVLIGMAFLAALCFEQTSEYSKSSEPSTQPVVQSNATTIHTTINRSASKPIIRFHVPRSVFEDRVITDEREALDIIFGRKDFDPIAAPIHCAPK